MRSVLRLALKVGEHEGTEGGGRRDREREEKVNQHKVNKITEEETKVGDDRQ